MVNYLGKNYSNNFNDDDVSEILIKVFLNLSKYDASKSKFSTWVISIAKNHMIDKWRVNTITLTGNNTSITSSFDSVSNTTYCVNESIQFNDNDLNSTSFTSNSDGHDFEYCSSINLISDQISLQDYTLLNMKYIEGYNYDEIGNEFNLTSTTVSNRVNYIKNKLRKNNINLYYD